jgi:hypothetical protein
LKIAETKEADERRGEIKKKSRNEVKEKRHKEVFAGKLNLEIGGWNTLPLTWPSNPAPSGLVMQPYSVFLSIFQPLYAFI